MRVSSSLFSRLLLPVFFAAVLPGCTGLLFYPMERHVIMPDDIGQNYREIHVEVEPGLSLHGWLLLADAERAGTIVYLHGNGENISTHMANVYWLTEHGYDVYLFDYRGYGESDGEAELDAILADNEKLLAYVAARQPDDERFVLMGHSLGGSLAIHTAATTAHGDSLAALVTVSAFSDYRRITQETLARSWLFWLFQWPLSFTVDNSYSPEKFIGRVSPVPVLIMHSREDELIPFHHALDLYEAAREPRILIEGTGDHNHFFNQERNRSLLLDYLDATLKPRDAG